jgi:hypothetical protein
MMQIRIWDNLKNIRMRVTFLYTHQNCWWKFNFIRTIFQIFFNWTKILILLKECRPVFCFFYKICFHFLGKPILNSTFLNLVTFQKPITYSLNTLTDILQPLLFYCRTYKQCAISCLYNVDTCSAFEYINSICTIGIPTKLIKVK